MLKRECRWWQVAAEVFAGQRLDCAAMDAVAQYDWQAHAASEVSL